METKTLNVAISEAREWYNGGNETLRKLALRCYSLDDLKVVSFEKIKSFEDAVNALNMDLDFVSSVISDIETTSKASAAMYKLNIVRKALNIGQDLHLTKGPEDSYIYYPINPIVSEGSTYYKEELKSDKMEIIGKIMEKGVEYCVLNGDPYSTFGFGLCGFNVTSGIGVASANLGFLGCANEKIAKHFGKYFGMLITEAKYGDLQGFEIVGKKNQN